MALDVVASMALIFQKPLELLGWEPIDLAAEIDLSFINKILPYMFTFHVEISDAFVEEANMRPGIFIDTQFKG